MSLLVVDIGNTNLVLGLFEGDQLACSFRLHTNRHQTADEYGLLLKNLLLQAGYQPGKVEGVGVSNVVPVLATRIEEACRRYLGHEPCFVSSRLELGLKLDVDRPTEVGADLIAGAVAAHHLWGMPSVVVDLGTATTISVLANDSFLGTVIAPGLEISVDAISQRAPHLPGIRMEAPPRPFGTNTVHSLQAGLVLGHVAMIDGLVERIREHLDKPDLKVGATGGLASLVSGMSRTISEVQPDLVLEGIRLLYSRNR